MYCADNPVNNVDQNGTSYQDGRFSHYDAFTTYIDFVFTFGILGLKFFSSPSTHSTLSAISSVASKISATLGIIGVGVNTVTNIIENVQNGAGILRTATDAVVDITIGISSLLINAAIVSAIGSFIPGVGNLVGFIVGLGYGLFMYYIGDELIGKLKDWFYNFSLTIANNINNYMTPRMTNMVMNMNKSAVGTGFKLYQGIQKTTGWLLKFFL